jgi:hypothetical protein
MNGRTEGSTHPKLGAIRIFGDRNINLYIISGTSPFKLGLALDHVLNAGALMGFDGSLYPNKRLDGGGEAVGHELKLAVWRDEGDSAVVFEP